MSVNLRKGRNFKRRFAAYTLLFGVLGCIFFYFNFFYFSEKSLFISPIGEVKGDVSVIKKKLKEKNISFSEVLPLSDSAYLINIPNDKQVKLSSIKDIDKQISSLQRILIQLTIEGKLFKSIDFRFSEPVVSF